MSLSMGILIIATMSVRHCDEMPEADRGQPAPLVHDIGCHRAPHSMRGGRLLGNPAYGMQHNICCVALATRHSVPLAIYRFPRGISAPLPITSPAGIPSP